MIGFDTETYLIRRGRLTPRAVCLTLAGRGEPPAWLAEAAGDTDPDHLRLAVLGRNLARREDDLSGGAGWTAIATRPAIPRLVPPLFRERTVAHNWRFDAGVLVRAYQDTHPPLAGRACPALSAVFEALKEGRGHDTEIRERILTVALDETEFRPKIGGGMEKTALHLADLVRRYFGADLSSDKSGADSWRLRYSELDGVPLSDWPAPAVSYAVADAAWALAVAEEQGARDLDLGGFPVVLCGGHFLTESREAAAAWALHLEAVQGLRTDPDRVRATIGDWTERADRGAEIGQRCGWVRADGSVSKSALQARVEAAYPDGPPRTAPTGKFPRGQTKTDATTLEDSRDPDLVEYAKSTMYRGFVSKYAEVLALGAEYALTSRPNHLVATGRTSWSDPPLQQPPKDGGFRECFRAREGHALVSIDYATIELRALAQVCLWLGVGDFMAVALRSGIDLHWKTAAAIASAEAGREVTIAEVMADPRGPELRQLAKALNFGLPGGLRAQSFVAYAHSAYNVTISLERAEALIEIWFATYPEIRAYFGWVNSQIAPFTGTFTARQFVSGRVRGGVRKTAGYNTYFQGLVADGAKFAAFQVAAECYTDPTSPAWGSRPVLFLHDEILVEVPIARLDEAAARITEIMIAAMKLHIPDIPIEAEPAAMLRWSKSAKTVRDTAGRLVPCDA